MASAYPGYGGPQLPPANYGYPYQANVNANYNSNSSSTFNIKAAEDARAIARTPSPTPSEDRELKSGVLDWKTLGNWRFWIRKDWIWYYVIFTLILVITALVSIDHTQIVNGLTPVTRFLKRVLNVGKLVNLAFSMF